MSVNGATSQIRMNSSTGDAYGVYLTENVPTGGNGWTAHPGRERLGNTDRRPVPGGGRQILRTRLPA